jgi:hypothetical protein
LGPFQLTYLRTFSGSYCRILVLVALYCSYSDPHEWPFGGSNKARCLVLTYHLSYQGNGRPLKGSNLYESNKNAYKITISRNDSTYIYTNQGHVLSFLRTNCNGCFLVSNNFSYSTHTHSVNDADIPTHKGPYQVTGATNHTWSNQARGLMVTNHWSNFHYYIPHQSSNCYSKTNIGNICANEGNLLAHK